MVLLDQMRRIAITGIVESHNRGAFILPRCDRDTVSHPGIILVAPRGDIARPGANSLTSTWLPRALVEVKPKAIGRADREAEDPDYRAGKVHDNRVPGSGVSRID